jgi:(p)ppGpp synthase/HD superfamily hydrolase
LGKDINAGRIIWFKERYEPRDMSTLERAIVIAAEGHAGQLDKAGNPYVLHPLRVMLRLDTNEEHIAGVLHDVVEDCGWSIEDLRAEGFSEAVLSAVEAVTKREGESYDDFVARAAADSIGRRVKLADLEDNCDLRRISNPTPKDYERIEKYKRAIRMIQSMP